MYVFCGYIAAVLPTSFEQKSIRFRKQILANILAVWEWRAEKS